MTIRIKRVYDPPEAADGPRILVDRLWPRGLSKEKACIDYWPKEIAPSSDLRNGYRHDPEKWDTFKTRYFSELDGQPEAVAELLKRIKAGPVTLVYGSRETRFNNAAALRAYLEARF